MSEDIYGPKLPPGFGCNSLDRLSTSSDSKSCNSSINSTSTVCLHDTHEKEMIGPIIPKHLQTKLATAREESDKDDDGNIEDIYKDDDGNIEDISDDDLNCIGPLPNNDISSSSRGAAKQIEERASQMKRKLLNLEEVDRDESKMRESWMTELPPEFTQNFGVTARTFRSKAPKKDVDRSCWTDTPAERARKEMQTISGNSCSSSRSSTIDQALAKKDQSYSKQVEEYNETVRPKSLMALHTEKLTGGKKSKMKKSSKHKSKHSSNEKYEKSRKDKHRKKSKSDKNVDEKSERKTVETRRPFDRDVDLKTNRMDAAARQSVINRSQQLSGRFGSGSSQFL